MHERLSQENLYLPLLVPIFGRSSRTWTYKPRRRFMRPLRLTNSAILPNSIFSCTGSGFAPSSSRYTIPLGLYSACENRIIPSVLLPNCQRTVCHSGFTVSSTNLIYKFILYWFYRFVNWILAGPGEHDSHGRVTTTHCFPGKPATLDCSRPQLNWWIWPDSNRRPLPSNPKI